MTAMETSAVGSASGGMVGSDGQLSVPTELESGFLAGHQAMGAWQTERGMMLQPYELDKIESTSAMGGSARGYSPSPDGKAPSETIDVDTPLTHGGGSFAK